MSRRESRANDTAAIAATTAFRTSTATSPRPSASSATVPATLAVPKTMFLRLTRSSRWSAFGIAPKAASGMFTRKPSAAT